MSSRTKLLLAALAVVLPLIGCGGKNAVLREDAAKLSAEMEAVVAQSRQFYKRQSEARADFILQILAQGKYCNYFVPVDLVIVPNEPIRCRAPEEQIQLGKNGQPPPQPKPLPANAQTYTIDIFDAPKQSALQTIAVLAEFQSGVAKLLEEPSQNAAERLQKLVDRACALSKRLTEVGGDGLKQCEPSEDGTAVDASKIYTDERDALSAVINLARKAIADKNSVDQLKKAYKEHGAALSASMASLLKRYRDKDLAYKRALDTSAQISARRELNLRLDGIDPIAAGGRKGELDAAARYKLMADHYAKEKVIRLDGGAPDPLIVSLEGLIKTDAAFQSALLSDKLSEEMRARIAKSTFDQLKSWLRALYTLTTVF